MSGVDGDFGDAQGVAVAPVSDVARFVLPVQAIVRGMGILTVTIRFGDVDRRDDNPVRSGAGLLKPDN